MDKKTVETVKTILGGVIGSGTMMVVGDIIAASTPGGLGLLPRVFRHIGAMAFSAMLADKTSDWANEKIDSTTKEIVEAVKEVETNEKPEVDEAV